MRIEVNYIHSTYGNHYSLDRDLVCQPFLCNFTVVYDPWTSWDMACHVRLGDHTCVPALTKSQNQIHTKPINKQRLGSEAATKNLGENLVALLGVCQSKCLLLRTPMSGVCFRSCWHMAITHIANVPPPSLESVPGSPLLTCCRQWAFGPST